MTKNRDNCFHKGRLSKDRFTDKELEILAFTLSLVGAVKAVIDSPIIAQNGEVFRDENNNLNDMQECLDVYESVCTEMRAWFESVIGIYHDFDRIKPKFKSESSSWNLYTYKNEQINKVMPGSLAHILLVGSEK